MSLRQGIRDAHNGCMSGRAIALLGAVCVAALGIYIKSRRAGGAASDLLHFGRIEIDDDAAADIIKRARPALDQARELYAI